MKGIHFCLYGFICLMMACQSSETASNPEGSALSLFSQTAELRLPIQMNDSLLNQTFPKSGLIPPATWKGQIPDSAFRAIYGKRAQPTLAPLGRVQVKGGETYVFTRTSQSGKQAVYLLAFNQDGNYAAAMPFVADEAGRHFSGNMDTRYTITTVSKQKNKDQLQYSKEVFVYNTVGDFTLILTESNEAKNQPLALVNPLDTFPATHPVTGDYFQDKKNLVSFRDGKNPQQVQVFVHFEKNNNSCSGEVKGMARMTSATTAVFTESNSPCEILFTFSGNTVQMKEATGCGSHRDIKCFFEGSFTRKPKPVAKKPKSNTKK
jgi:hypothetical protein